jgi:hypothetical protein
MKSSPDLDPNKRLSEYQTKFGDHITGLVSLKRNAIKIRKRVGKGKK